MKKKILSASILCAIIAIIAVRLAANKNSFNKELKMVSESNTTIPIITDTVKYEQMASGFSINGTFSPAQEITITAETQGNIISIRSDVGDKVVKGQALASIDNRLAASQLRLAKFNLEKAEKDMNRFKQLSQGDAVTMQQFETTKQDFEAAQSAYTNAKVENDHASIKAPFNGIITKRYVDNGAYLAPGSTVFDLVEIKSLKFIAKLTAAEAEKVQTGQQVALSVDAFPGVTYAGKVCAVVVKADLSKRYDVEIEVNNNTDKLIKPGMFGTVVFTSRSNEQNLVIPRQAIAGSLKNPTVFLVKGHSVFMKNIVATSLNDKQVVVQEGLKVGDIIVTSGQISLVNGSNIKIIR